MGFLDYFDNPDWISSLIGPTSANASSAPAPPPPQSAMAPSGPSFGPAPDPGASMLVPRNLTYPSPINAPPPQQMTSGVPGGPGPAPVTNVTLPPDQIPATSSDPQLAADRAADANVIRTNSPNAGVMGAQPAAQPQINPANGPPSRYVDLAQSLGLPANSGYARQQLNELMSPEGRRRDAVATFLAALGSGLSAGSGGRGVSGGQAFAAGAGGALLGGARMQNVQQQQRRQAINDLFNQSSTAFRDMVLADQADDRHAYTGAQMDYLHARAGALAAGGTGRSTNAYINTPEGRFSVAEQRVQAFDTPRRKSIDALVRQGTITPEEADKRYKDLDQQTAQFRKNVYRGMNITERQAEDIKTKGTKQNPYDARTMSEDDFNARVPMGGFYLNHKGKLRQRIQPPPGSEQPAKPNTYASDQYGVALDDQQAMTPASE